MFSIINYFVSFLGLLERTLNEAGIEEVQFSGVWQCELLCYREDFIKRKVKINRDTY